MRTYKNPILPGLYPDPSICRVGEDYYLVNSTFTYFPGIPIFHSRDLVNWRQIGNVLDRPSQLDLRNGTSNGVQAATIRYNKGTFYITSTCDKNFVVTARNPEGPWSEPYWVEDAPGIDSSLFFDEDCRAYFTGNRIPPEGPRFRGEREIWIQELDLNTMKLTGEKKLLWNGIGGLWPEGPHVYKIDGWYYLLIAEGTTYYEHAVTFARSRCVWGPYEGCPNNPVLTHRHLGYQHPIVNVGHADIVETQKSEWWMVVLGSRTHKGSCTPEDAEKGIYHRSNMGRETFLVPMTWQGGWPIVSPGSGKVEFKHKAPNLPECRWQQEESSDDFDKRRLGLKWLFYRTPKEDIYSLTERPGFLRLKLRPEKIDFEGNPSFIGRRLQHLDFTASTVMYFTPKSENETAGMVLLRSNNANFRLTYSIKEEIKVLSLIKCKEGKETILVEEEVEADKLFLKVVSVKEDYSFYYGVSCGIWNSLAAGQDSLFISDDMEGTHSGTLIGMYASSNGSQSDNFADFDWFEYIGNQEMGYSID